MRTIRIHVDQPLAVGTNVALPAQAAEHVVRVLRMGVGDPLVLFNGDGREFAAVIDQVRGTRVSVTVGPPASRNARRRGRSRCCRACRAANA